MASLGVQLGELAAVAVVCAFAAEFWTSGEVFADIQRSAMRRREASLLGLGQRRNNHPPRYKRSIPHTFKLYLTSCYYIVHHWIAHKFWVLMTDRTCFLLIPVAICILTQGHHLIVSTWPGLIYAWMFTVYTAEFEIVLFALLTNAQLLETSTQRAITAGAKLLEQKLDAPHDHIGPITVQSRRGGVSIGGVGENYPNWPMNGNGPSKPNLIIGSNE